MSTNIELIAEKAKELLSQAKENFESMNELKEWDSLGEIITNVGKISAFLTNLVGAVEVATNDLEGTLEDLTSEDKLKAAAVVLDELIELPWFVEKVDGFVFEMLISVCVDWLNKAMKGNWNLDKIRDALAKGKDFLNDE